LAGNHLTYTITVGNAGLATATGVILTAVLPAGADFSSAVIDQGNFTVENWILTWNIGILAGGEVTEAQIVIIPRIAGVITILAVVTGNESAARVIVETATVTPVSLSGLTQLAIAFGKIRQVVPTGIFKNDLLARLAQVENLLQKGAVIEALAVVNVIIRKIMVEIIRRNQVYTGFNLALGDLVQLQQALLDIV
jgi:uncharacterized repeat protein (TIGR01451 family)